MPACKLMAVTRTTVTIYGWILKIVQLLTGITSSLARIESVQAAQSKQLAEIITMLTPSDPVAFRIELKQSNQENT